MLERLLRAGADAFRVNMSHGDKAGHAAVIKAIRDLEARFNRPIAILADLQGPKLRVGTFKEGRAVIRHSGHFTLDQNPEPGDETRVHLPHPELFGILSKGQRLLVNDGQNPAEGHSGGAGLHPVLGRGGRCHFRSQRGQCSPMWRCPSPP